MPAAGLWSTAAAFLLWGLFPLYFQQVAAVPSFEVVLHRCVWALVFVLLILAVQRRWAWLSALRQQPRVVAVSGICAVLLSLNWLIYVWAVHHGRVVEASLGYFINPLVNVLLGVWLLHERPRPAQWVAIAVAATGVVWIGWAAGAPPWIALTLACSFGVYGLLRKTATLGALEGLALETMLLAPLAVPALVWAMWLHHDAYAAAPPAIGIWLLAAGPLTVVPLLLFAYGARRVPLATVGLLQYLGPSMQFALGIWWFGEPLDTGRATGFGLIWAALVIYSFESLWQLRRPAAAAAAPPA